VERFWKNVDVQGREKDNMKQWELDERVLAADLARTLIVFDVQKVLNNK
jgi:hypothetical protein